MALTTHSSMADTLSAKMPVTDTLMTDNDSVPAVMAMTFSSQQGKTFPEIVARTPDYTSWIIGGLLLLFVIVCLRVKSSAKYIKVLVRDLTDVRERHNAFDETVRETSLLVILNLFWSCCIGVLMYTFLEHNHYIQGNTPMLSIMVCEGIAGGYTLVMTGVYWLVGNVFSDSLHAKMWVKGFAAEQGLSAMLMFPLALCAMCYTQYSEQILTIALITFVIGKIIFICKGFRIFFTQIASWVLFLYYLCSLEIVPLILTFLAADYCCRSL